MDKAIETILSWLLTNAGLAGLFLFVAGGIIWLLWRALEKERKAHSDTAALLNNQIATLQTARLEEVKQMLPVLTDASKVVTAYAAETSNRTRALDAHTEALEQVFERLGRLDTVEALIRDRLPLR